MRSNSLTILFCLRDSRRLQSLLYDLGSYHNVIVLRKISYQYLLELYRVSCESTSASGTRSLGPKYLGTIQSLIRRGLDEDSTTRSSKFIVQ
jgi:hypothetical protein